LLNKRFFAFGLFFENREGLKLMAPNIRVAKSKLMQSKKMLVGEDPF
jgi:hypothetical protein